MDEAQLAVDKRYKNLEIYEAYDNHVNPRNIRVNLLRI